MSSAQEKSRIEKPIEKLGVIAGRGSLPGSLLAACEHKGIEVLVVGFKGQTDPALLEGRSHILTRPGAAGYIIQALKNENIRDLVLIGGLRRPSLKELRPDLRAARFFARIGLQALGDDGLLKALRRELQDEGFTIHGIQDFAAELLAAEGPLGRLRPGRKDRPDIRRGLEVLKGTGPYDVGQALVVQEGIVLGIEAAEGTDELIRRCYGYRRKGRPGVLIKLAKPGQDQAIDLPVVGPDTIRLCTETGIGGIVIHAGSSLIAEPDEVARLADEAGIFVLGINPEKPPL